MESGDHNNPLALNMKSAESNSVLPNDDIFTTLALEERKQSTTKADGSATPMRLRKKQPKQSNIY